MGDDKLRHFAVFPVLSIRDIKQVNPADNICHYTKPRGLWVSDEAAEMSWSNWCESESFGIGMIEHVVELAPGANVIRIETIDQLDAFGDKYGARPDHHLFKDEPAIQWADVAKAFDGIIITPYQWERRMHRGSSWYYGWDCASGCIWRRRAVARIEPIRTPREFADMLEYPPPNTGAAGAR